MASNFNLNTESDDKQKEHLITIEYNKKCKKAPLLFDQEDFYTVYSPKRLELKPRDSCILNLLFNVTSDSKEIDPWISIIPTHKCRGLAIISKTVNPNKEIELYLQNQSYNYTVEVKKYSSLAFIFLLGLMPRDIIKTEYVCNYK